jgi:large subunit ribosomal protein L3
MEYIVEKIGMSRTVDAKSKTVTLLKVQSAKVLEKYENGKALIAYSKGKKDNKAIEGIRKKYDLGKEFNKFATLFVGNEEEFKTDSLSNAQVLKSSFNSKGRGFSGVVKRYGFSGGPKSHGSRFHRAPGSIGNAEFPGRVAKGKKMPGQYGNVKITVKNNVISFDPETNILVVEGSIPGPNGAFGRVKVAK